MLDSFLFSKHLEEDESASMIVHQHWSVGVTAVLFPTLAFFLSFSLLALSTTKGGLLVGGAMTLLATVWWLRNFLDFYLDVWIVTDHGIIDLEWRGFFHRQASRVLYSDVQGVSYETAGLSATLFRYGTVSVEKISTGAAISLPNVPRPRSVEACILKNMESYLHSKNMKNSKHVQDILADFIAGKIQMDGMAKKGGTSAENNQDGAEEKPASRKRTAFRSSQVGSKRS